MSDFSRTLAWFPFSALLKVSHILLGISIPKDGSLSLICLPLRCVERLGSSNRQYIRCNSVMYVGYAIYKRNA